MYKRQNKPNGNQTARPEVETIDIDEVLVQAADEIASDQAKTTKKRKSIDASVEIKKVPGRTCKKLRGTQPGSTMHRSPTKKSDLPHGQGQPAGQSSEPGAPQGPSAQPPGEGWELVMQRMLGGLEHRFKARMDSSDTGLHDKIDDVQTDLRRSIRSVSDDVEKLQARVELGEKGLESRIENVVNRMTMQGGQGLSAADRSRIGTGPRPRFLAAQQGPSGSGAPVQNRPDDDRYWRARKSLRLWPVIGQDLHAAVAAYFTGPLMMEGGIEDDVPGFEIRRVRSAKGKRAHEVIITFPDVETRDAVRSAAPRLAGKKDMGMRLEIPEALRPSLRALDSTSYLLKQTNPLLKRNIKYDDEVMDLVMDIKLNEAAPWRKIRPDQAMDAKKNRAVPSREDRVELDSAAIQSFLSAASSSQAPATGANATSLNQ